jgi:hypothetical protein
MSAFIINHLAESEIFMSLESADETSIEEYKEEKEIEPVPRGKGIYIVIALVIVAIVVFGIVFTLLVSGWAGGISWWAPMQLQHEPITDSFVGEKIELKAIVTGNPRNVTINYLIDENNVTVTPYSPIAWFSTFMLSVGEGSDQYSYTIPANEVTGDIYYYILATDTYGNTKATKITRVAVADFYIEDEGKDLVVYTDKTDSTKIRIVSINHFNREVSLKISDLPGGLIAEFNPSTVTLSEGGTAESTLTARMASAEYIPGGRYEVIVEGKYSGPSGSVIRETNEITVKAPDFDFSISPRSQEIRRSEIGSETYYTEYRREKIVTYDIELTLRNEFQGDLTFDVEGLPSERAYHRFVLADDELLGEGTSHIYLQVVLESGVERGTYTLVVTIEGGGFERDELVTLTILSSTGYLYDDYYRR